MIAHLIIEGGPRKQKAAAAAATRGWPFAGAQCRGHRPTASCVARGSISRRNMKLGPLWTGTHLAAAAAAAVHSFLSLPASSVIYVIMESVSGGSLYWDACESHKSPALTRTRWGSWAGSMGWGDRRGAAMMSCEREGIIVR